MYYKIVSLFRRYNYHWESNFWEIWLDNTAIVRIVGFSFFTHKKVKSRSNRADETTGAIAGSARVWSISYILSMLGSIDNFGIDSSFHKPFIDDGEVVVTISGIAGMMIFSVTFCQFDIPIICSTMQSYIITQWIEFFWFSDRIIPIKPSSTNDIHIDIWRWLNIG